jgi:hypothetical protein
LNEKIIKIKNIDPKELFGLRNKNLDFIKSSFPKLKIITRGDEIKVFGDDKLLLEFESKLQIIFNYYLEYNSISENEIKALIKSDSISDVKTSKKSHGAILHGVGGKPFWLKAQYRFASSSPTTHGAACRWLGLRKLERGVQRSLVRHRGDGERDDLLLAAGSERDEEVPNGAHHHRFGDLHRNLPLLPHLQLLE